MNCPRVSLKLGFGLSGVIQWALGGVVGINEVILNVLTSKLSQVEAPRDKTFVWASSLVQSTEQSLRAGKSANTLISFSTYKCVKGFNL